MTSEIISIGTELLLGNTINTNTAFLSEQLAALGIDVYYHTTVGDNPKRLQDTLYQAVKRSELIITTGGLGPTADDITKEVICEAAGKRLVLHKPSLDRIDAFFKRIGKSMSPNNIKQAYIPEDGMAVYNHTGTAPGIIMELDNCTIIMLPGPPSEMETMFLKEIKPYLQEKSPYTIISRTIKFFGIGESALESKLRDIIDRQSDPTIATYAGEGEVKVRITTKTVSGQAKLSGLEQVTGVINDRVGEYIYAYDDLSLEHITAELLISSPYTLSLAESCTGGRVSSMLTSVPGVSKSFKGTIVSYSNDIKTNLLGVKKETLETYGAVSRETAIEMAEGARKMCNAHIGLSITGIAGPDGRTPDKPVGLVYIALCTAEGCECFEHRFAGDRTKIQIYAAKHAINYLRKFLVKHIRS